jgi:TolA-binding protein
MISLSKRNIILAATAGVIIVTTSSVAAFNQLSTTTAEETPVEVKVEDHEQRLTKNESDIAETKDRVESVEQQAAANTNTIHEVQKQVLVVEGKQEAQNQQARAQQPATVALTPEPQPAPAKTVNPRLIIAVQAEEQTHVWSCDYTLETGRVINSLQSATCSGVGSEISADLAAMWGIR